MLFAQQNIKTFVWWMTGNFLFYFFAKLWEHRFIFAVYSSPERLDESVDRKVSEFLIIPSCRFVFVLLNCSNFQGTCFTPWSNGVASRRKFTYLRLRLTRPCVHFRWLAMTCAHFGRNQINICRQYDASFLPFGHPSQANASWVTSIKPVLVNKILDISALK